MFRMKRTLCASLVLLLGVMLSPLPATAGSAWEGPSVVGEQGWEGLWADLLGWLGLAPTYIEMSSAHIDPNGSKSSPHIDPDGSTTATSSPYIDPNGQGSATADSSPMVDPNGLP
jgi:hypothetical protein